MSTRRLPVDRLPHWPRHLSRELAAAYVGVSPNLFDAEIQQGKWPAGTGRGAKGARHTWDRLELDRRSDAALPSVEEVREDDFERRRREAADRRRRETAGRQHRPAQAR